MLLLRRFEEKVGQLYGMQKIRGFCHLYIGQEAVAAGCMTATNPDDKFITAYRCHALAIAKGVTPKSSMAELYGKATGCSKGKGGSMHLFGVDVGFFGDGAARQGMLHEVFNMAMLWDLPVVFICENNHYAMGTSVARTSKTLDIYKLADAYDMPADAVDGMSPEDVHNAVLRAANRAREKGGPTLLEIKTYRYKGHSMSDPQKYRSKDEVEEYKEKDPIDHVLKVLKTDFAITEEAIEAINDRVKLEVEEAVQFAEDSPWPDEDELFKDVYIQEDYPYITD